MKEGGGKGTKRRRNMAFGENENEKGFNPTILLEPHPHLYT